MSTIPEYPGVQLVQQSFPRVSALLVKYASRKINTKLAALGAHLCAFAEETSSFSDGIKRALERDRRIDRLLSQVEQVICFQDTSVQTIAKYPTLRKVAAAQSFVEDTEAGGVSGLFGLDTFFWGDNSQASSSLATNIKKAVSKRRIDYDSLFEILDLCSEITAKDELVESTDLDANSRYEDVSDYTKRAKEVRKILANHALCSCTDAENPANTRHRARLRLKPVYSADDHHQLRFDMLFSATLNPLQGGTLNWQEVQILLSTRKASKGKTIHFAGDPVPQRQGAEEHHGQMSIQDSKIVDSLCELIIGNYGSVLYFKVIQQRLTVLLDPPGPSHLGNSFAAQVGLRLGDILERFDMRYGMRPVLAYTIAKAVWLHYDSDWMSVATSSDDIFFMGEEDDGDTNYFCKPYLSTDIHTEFQQREPECRQVIGMMHRYPRVLALGIVLVEIATRQHIYFESHPSTWTPKYANEVLTTLRKSLQNESFQEDCHFPRYKLAAAKCLDPILFKNAPFNPGRPEENLEARRTILHDEIVEPLRKLIEGTGWDAEFDEMERTAMVPRHREREPLKHLPANRVPKAGSEMNPLSSLESYKKSRWIEQVSQLNHMVRKDKKQGTKSSRIKLAILDTGYDTNAPTFDIPSRSKNITWHDFVSNSIHPVDTDGHGTHLLTLLLKLEVQADIFVARITENSQSLKTAEINVAQAIHKAAHEWDVDFISLSFGFPHHVKGIRDAINDAVHHKDGAITILAAANNDGFNSWEMFPANLGDKVISIRGTNEDGAFDPRFNPPMSSSESVFGTLGVDVHSDWIGHELSRSMSGCSVATPIALSIAVMVLKYASNRTDHFSPQDLRLLKTRRGIFELFKEISIPAGNERHYLSPFELFKLREDVRLARLKSALGRHPERLGA
ncbi:hypothetical protein CMEL01_09182 [Colletotrichum melonis]|uniref:Peptidase S8/S53 domain-containing protein n=1 Tax=Colletotrichum melonis TaxID=1209925 RepID=A0AAI9XFR5_9PEZI|nr:hypothetical protein CMEL01_09182 [Colletotrichum melonis]